MMRRSIPDLPPNLPIEQDQRWASVVSRDRSADGASYYSVRTTGVYCRPSCAARLANPRNVGFQRLRRRQKQPASASANGASPISDLQDRFPKAKLIGGDAAFEALVASVAGFIEAPHIGLDLPLDIRGTAFQQKVWQALRDIPPGATLSYSEIAGKIGVPKAVRAVAGACAANALAVAIPRHRVIRNDGALSGYRWGVERKRVLLQREAGAAKRA